jgi:hypothetical protein
MKRSITPEELEARFAMEFQSCLEEVVANPTKVFEVADRVKELGYHHAAEKLQKNGFSHAAEHGICGAKGAPEDAVVWGDGYFRQWIRPNRFFHKDLKSVAQRLMPRTRKIVTPLTTPSI